jgi:hypothetical protein
MELSGSDAQGNKSQPISAGDFQAALSLTVVAGAELHVGGDPGGGGRQPAKTRPAKAIRAGAKVEKNW